MTKKIFWENPYLTELETTVQTVEEDKVILNETIFYAFSSGQESNRGTFNGLPVLEAKKIGKEIFYILYSSKKSSFLNFFSQTFRLISLHLHKLNFLRRLHER